MAENNSSLLTNLLWKFAERISAQLVTLIVSLILARLLEPEDYGMVSIVMIFITIANVFVSDGFGSALIQKKDADALDFSTVLYFNIGFSIVLYLILFLSAPIIQRFYGGGYELITPVLRVLGVRLILSAINSVQQAYISKKMMFRMFFLSTFLGTVISAIVGIVLAYKGAGVWALVAQYLTNTTVDTIVLNIRLKMKPLVAFSFQRLRGLFKYGVNILGASLLVCGYQELRALIIGKIYTSSDLAFYDRAKQFPQLFVTNINSSIEAVLFPKMSNEQDNRTRVKETVRMSIRFSSFFICPLMIGLATVAEPLVRLLLTEKWLACVPLLQLFCILYLVQPIHTGNMQAIKAIGRSDVFAKLEVIKKAIELVSLLLIMRKGVAAIVLNMTMLNILFVFINALPNVKLLNYKFNEQMKDILPNLLKSLVMGALVYSMNFINLSEIVLLCLQVVAGVLVYIILSIVTNSREFSYIIDMLKCRLKKV